MQDSNKILNTVRDLVWAYKEGRLGGDIMPEDSNPGLELGSAENYLYFTLPMALNYQRNSYKLWESAETTYTDMSTRAVFNPKKVIHMTDLELRNKLVKHKVALQQNKQPIIWRRICQTLVDYYDGDVRMLFKECEFDIEKILNNIQKTNKKGFPYLSGNKIGNYWLYVITQYTDAKLTGRDCLNVAPDTHIIQASAKLGVIGEVSLNDSQIQIETMKRWEDILEGTEFDCIDIHTPLWLWSRGGFPDVWKK